MRQNHNAFNIEFCYEISFQYKCLPKTFESIERRHKQHTIIMSTFKISFYVAFVQSKPETNSNCLKFANYAQAIQGE